MGGRRLGSQFRKVIRAGLKRTQDQVIELHTDHTIALIAELQARTPKKSGLLASSWRSRVNQPSAAIPKVIRYEREAGTRQKLKKLKVGDTVWVVNNQPYANRIEHGWGKKNPPSGFVRPALKAYTKRLPKRKIG